MIGHYNFRKQKFPISLLSSCLGYKHIRSNIGIITDGSTVSILQRTILILQRILSINLYRISTYLNKEFASLYQENYFHQR